MGYSSFIWSDSAGVHYYDDYAFFRIENIGKCPKRVDAGIREPKPGLNPQRLCEKSRMGHGLVWCNR